MTMRTFAIGMMLIATSSSALGAQEAVAPSAAEPVTVEASAPPPPAAAKPSLTEKIAVAAGILGAGFAAFKALKKPKAIEPAPSQALAPQ